MEDIVRTVYVISDLHLGGEPEQGRRGFRINTHEADLAEFIKSIGARQDNASELILNGDTFDFLAEKAADKEPFWKPFRNDETAAVDCLNTITRRCQGVIDALRSHLQQGHRLVILPGNHDIELSLPAMRKRLQELMAPHGGDYEFIGNGEAYRIGDVVIEHGDRLDEMNFVDYNLLRRYNGHLSRGLAIREEDEFDPPAGSKLVASVLNDIKRTYRFIDLLKPGEGGRFPSHSGVGARPTRRTEDHCHRLARGQASASGAVETVQPQHFRIARRGLPP
jgi:UDP-2,3-diacylglucosamine pyrophosphatase LpxH